MTQQPAMPSRHVCQVKYRKVGLEQGEGDTRYHVVPMPAAGHAQQGGLCQGAIPATPSKPHCASPGHTGQPRCLQERAQRGDGTSQGTGQPLAASPWQTGVMIGDGAGAALAHPGGQVASGSAWQHRQPWCPLRLAQGGGGREAQSCYFL